jgi:hypothetical protein
MQADDRFVYFVFFRVQRRNSAGRSLRFLKDGTTVSGAELLLGLALILLSLLGTWYVLKGRSDALALERDPVSVQGTVLGLWVTTGKGAAYHVRYSYRVGADNSLLLRQEATLTEKQYRQLKVGGPVPVLYCRTNPANHLLQGTPPPSFASWWVVSVALLVLVLVAAAGCINLWAWWGAREWPEKGGD